jgi:hypothetical protein
MKKLSPSLLGLTALALLAQATGCATATATDATQSTEQAVGETETVLTKDVDVIRCGVKGTKPAFLLTFRRTNTTIHSAKAELKTRHEDASATANYKHRVGWKWSEFTSVDEPDGQTPGRLFETSGVLGISAKVDMDRKQVEVILPSSGHVLTITRDKIFIVNDAAPRTSEVTSPNEAPLCAINFDLIAGGENYLSRLAQQRANEEAKKRGGYR